MTARACVRPHVAAFPRVVASEVLATVKVHIDAHRRYIAACRARDMLPELPAIPDLSEQDGDIWLAGQPAALIERINDPAVSGLSKLAK